ncbi:NAD-dependent deacylase [Histomonas meleagridis]|uniref:NAD-dependent deacylase n=1 Tax=Histomonas meleagridis TaxID=135588 RepID=UPI00355A4BA4|nr:NAD-dependent deacylase [Histomonas meleagridis]KAH0804387.1 NAD-dependent deacylase [Histomonas meleagridis]
MIPDFSNTVECVIELIKKYKGRIVIITGAGVSAHQLPTFRSNNSSGLWEAFSPPILKIDNFYSNPKPSWKLLANVRNLQVSNILHPSLTHYVIHYLIQRGYVSKLITQNIDGLHMFKSDVSHVIELHGAVDDFGFCEKCNKKRPVDNLAILQTGECPTCDLCKSVLRPNVAFFGDVIDHKKRQDATSAISNCDLLILVGTHCTVDPVLSMAGEAHRNGSILVEINLTKTHASTFMNISLEGKSDEIFKQIGKELFKDIDFDNINLEDWNK